MLKVLNGPKKPSIPGFKLVNLASYIKLFIFSLNAISIFGQILFGVYFFAFYSHHHKMLEKFLTLKIISISMPTSIKDITNSINNFLYDAILQSNRNS